MQVAQSPTWGILCPIVPLPGCLAEMMVSCVGMSQYQDVPVLGIGVSPCPRTWCRCGIWRCPIG